MKDREEFQGLKVGDDVTVKYCGKEKSGKITGFRPHWKEYPITIKLDDGYEIQFTKCEIIRNEGGIKCQKQLMN